MSGSQLAGYLADEGIAGVVYLADRLAKPVLVEGPAGTGKTELAKSVARVTDSRLIRLQCYEGLDESKALYEWNYKKQLLRIQAQQVVESSAGLHGEVPRWRVRVEGARRGHILRGIPPHPTAARSDPLGRPRSFCWSTRSTGSSSRPRRCCSRCFPSTRSRSPSSVRCGSRIPLVYLTSNNTRELSEALKRRCLYLHLDYPSLERERQIVAARVPGATEELTDQVARIVRSIRALELKKAPSVSETLDWARTLVVLGVETIDADVAHKTLNVLLKYKTDLDRVR